MRYLTTVCMLILLGMVSVDPCSAAIPSLWQGKNPKLQQQLVVALDKEFQDLFWQKVDRGKIGIAVVDITDVKHPRVAEINGDLMLYAASLPKIAILLGAFVEIERGNLQLDEEFQGMLTRMIRFSSNQDATEVLRRVGIQNLAEILRSERFRLYDPQHNGGLWIGKDYGGDLDWHRDPLNYVSHGATAMQAARFYYLAITRQLVADQLSDSFLDILSDSAINSKFVKGLHKYNPDAEIYRKSGTWRNFHADSGIVVDEDYRYIVVALAEHPRGAQALVRLIGVVEKVMQKRHPESPR